MKSFHTCSAEKYPVPSDLAGALGLGLRPPQNHGIFHLQDARGHEFDYQPLWGPSTDF